MDKIKLGLDEKDILGTIQLVNGIMEGMTGNANFTNPEPSDVVLQGLIDGAQNANAEYETAKAVVTAKLTVRDEKLELLRGGIRRRASWAEGKVAGNAALLQEAGFTMRAPVAPIGDLGKVMDLALTEGDHEGELDAQWNRVRGAKSYELHISTDPTNPTNWTHRDTATRSTHTLGGLTSGAKVWLRVRGVGAAGKGPWSDPAVKVVP